MKTINIIDHKGKKVNGRWNEKTYVSNISDHRIYVDNREIHITNTVYETIQPEIKEFEVTYIKWDDIEKENTFEKIIVQSRRGDRSSIWKACETYGIKGVDIEGWEEIA